MRLVILLSLLLAACGSNLEPMSAEAPAAAVEEAAVAESAASDGFSIPTPAPRAARPPKSIQPVADTILEQMLQASLVFTLPESAQYGDDLDAELVMSLKLSELELAAQNPDATLTAGIVVSRIVEARLSAPDFEIVSSTGTRQALSDTDDTVWRWQLRPKTAGLHRIRLTVVAAVDVGGERTERLVQTFDKTVVVEITHAQMAWSWLAEYWQWLFSTLLIPLGVWLWSRRKGA